MIFNYSGSLGDVLYSLNFAREYAAASLFHQTVKLIIRTGRHGSGHYIAPLRRGFLLQKKATAARLAKRKD